MPNPSQVTRLEPYDALVIGGGPAGACAANLLSAAGHSVAVLEREFFPRFHIGESLLPAELPVIERLGVDLDSSGAYLIKRGALFIDERSGRQATFSFDEGLPGAPPHAHQVERAIFDKALLDAAAREGAEVFEGHEVQAVEFEREAELVTVSGRRIDEEGSPIGEFVCRARYLVDASGLKALLARRNRSLEPYRELGRGAAYRCYHDLAPEVVEELGERGNVIIKVVEDGWMWGIPLAGGSLSLGVVKCRGKIDAALLEKEIETSPLLTRLTRGAAAGPVTVTGSFSFHNTSPAGSRFVCVGDAACFLDPVFSSGVTLALVGAEKMADILDAALSAGNEAEPALMDPLTAHMGRAYEAFERFIHRFYHSNLPNNILLAEKHASQKFRQGVISILAADVWRDDNDFQDMLLRSRRRRAQPPT